MVESPSAGTIATIGALTNATRTEPVVVLPSSSWVSSCLANFPNMPDEHMKNEPVMPVICVVLLMPILPPSAFF